MCELILNRSFIVNINVFSVLAIRNHTYPDILPTFIIDTVNILLWDIIAIYLNNHGKEIKTYI